VLFSLCFYQFEMMLMGDTRPALEEMRRRRKGGAPSAWPPWFWYCLINDDGYSRIDIIEHILCSSQVLYPGVVDVLRSIYLVLPATGNTQRAPPDGQRLAAPAISYGDCL
jgi:hypothetical protein